MAFFQIIIVLFLSSIAPLLFTLNNIVFYCQNRVFLVSFLLKIFFFILLIWLSRFINKRRSRGFSIGWLWFFRLRFFKFGFFSTESLYLDFQKVYMWIIVTLKITDIWVLDYDTRSKAYFGFYIDHFLYHLLKASQYAVLWLYFNFNGRLKFFSKITDYY